MFNEGSYFNWIRMASDISEKRCTVFPTSLDIEGELLEASSPMNYEHEEVQAPCGQPPRLQKRQKPPPLPVTVNGLQMRARGKLSDKKRISAKLAIPGNDTSDSLKKGNHGVYTWPSKSHRQLRWWLLKYATTWQWTLPGAWSELRM